MRRSIPATPISLLLLLLLLSTAFRRCSGDVATVADAEPRPSDGGWVLSRIIAPVRTGRIVVGIVDSGGFPAQTSARWSTTEAATELTPNARTASVTGLPVPSAAPSPTPPTATSPAPGATGASTEVVGLNTMTGGRTAADLADEVPPPGSGTVLAARAAKGGEVTIIPCKFLRGDGRGFVDEAAECIDFLVQNGADVIVAAWRAPDRPDSPLRGALDSAVRANGVAVLALAQQDPTAAPGLAASSPWVTPVNSTSRTAFGDAANKAALFIATARALGVYPTPAHVTAALCMCSRETSHNCVGGDLNGSAIVYAAVGLRAGAYDMYA
jgi:hypothetical protein